MVKVGSMTRAKRILLMAFVVVMSLSTANASWFRRKAEAPKAAAPSVAATSLTAVEVDASRVLLRTSATPAYTSYSPAPDVFVVDLASTTKAATVAIPATLPAGVTSISAEEAVEMGTRLTRVTFRLAHAAILQASASDKSVVVTVPEPVAPLRQWPNRNRSRPPSRKQTLLTSKSSPMLIRRWSSPRQRRCQSPCHRIRRRR